MATIGTFTKTEDGSYTGSIKTLDFTVKSATFRPIAKTNAKAPDYLVFAGDTECGTAKRKTSRANRDYLSVKLDDPSFSKPIWAAMVDAEDGYRLVWDRTRSVQA